MMADAKIMNDPLGSGILSFGLKKLRIDIGSSASTRSLIPRL